jgi:hypothetical protein
MENQQTIVNIIGLSPRCGTNFLKEILCLHPNSCVSNAKGEDYLLYHIDDIYSYANNVDQHWKPHWNNSKQSLLNALSFGIYHFLTSGIDDQRYSHIINKTPDPNNCHLHYDFFPNGKMIIILRDGRDILDSAMHTFPNKSIITHLNTWKRNAKIVRSQMKSKVFMQQTLIVRYEDLITMPEQTIRTILDYVGLAYEVYPFDQIDKVPIVGSSQIKDTSGIVKWSKVIPSEENKNNFQFIGRHNKWSWLLRMYFSLYGDKTNRSLGYK